MDDSDKLEIISAIEDLTTAIEMIAPGCRTEFKSKQINEAYDYLSAVKTSVATLRIDRKAGNKKASAYAGTNSQLRLGI